ncbi:ABC transporter permease subunit [Bordetella petrii]|nr:ABC transporter permease subunit [Bordetella petrii]
MIDILRDYGVSLLIGQYPHGPLGGLAMTLIIAGLSLLISIPFAIAVGLARVSPWRPVRLTAAAYVNVMRGMPLLLLIFWAYFFVPYLTGGQVSGATTMIWSLVLYEGAFLGEIVRAGIQAIPKGQAEAARALGLSYPQMMARIVLPQALFNMIPSLLSQFILLVKDTSLAYIIGTPELTYAADQVNAQLMTRPFEVYAILAGTYYILCYSLSRVANGLEKRIHVRRAARAAASQA